MYGKIGKKNLGVQLIKLRVCISSGGKKLNYGYFNINIFHCYPTLQDSKFEQKAFYF